MIAVSLGARVKMRKAHPCGSDEWIIYRMGTDIGLRCTGCEHRIMIPRSKFAKQLKQVLSSPLDVERAGSEE